MDTESECLKLLELLAQVIDANKSKKLDFTTQGWYAEGLANKFFNHAFFVLYLIRGQNTLAFPSREVTISCILSIDVLTRAAFEAFLTFHYVFYTPKIEAGKSYRYDSWILAGLMERQNFPAVTDEQKKVLDNDKKEIKEICDKLDSNEDFKGIADRLKRDISEGKWRLEAWSKIAADARLGKIIASNMYGHLCGYAHSSSLSVKQSKIAFNKHDEKLLMEPCLYIINILLGNMIFEYCELFESAGNVLAQNRDGASLADCWVSIGRGC